jgi:hypothetical protein
VHEVEQVIRKRTECVIACFVNRRSIDRNYTIYSIWVPASQRHSGPPAHRVAHNRKLLKAFLVGKAHDIVGHYLVVVLVVVVGASMVTHFNQEALATLTYIGLRAERPKVHL